MSAQSDRIVRELEAAVAGVQEELAGRLLAKLREHTPVRTGYTRSRWIVVQNGSRIVVSNDAGDVVMRLNDGWSQKAPAGFIERAISEVEQEVGVMIDRPIQIGTIGQFGGAIATNMADFYGFGGVFGGGE